MQKQRKVSCLGKYFLEENTDIIIYSSFFRKKKPGKNYKKMQVYDHEELHERTEY